MFIENMTDEKKELLEELFNDAVVTCVEIWLLGLINNSGLDIQEDDLWKVILTDTPQEMIEGMRELIDEAQKKRNVI